MDCTHCIHVTMCMCETCYCSTCTCACMYNNNAISIVVTPSDFNCGMCRHVSISCVCVCAFVCETCTCVKYTCTKCACKIMRYAL